MVKIFLGKSSGVPLGAVLFSVNSYLDSFKEIKLFRN
jgi:hypothetical protein